MPGLYVIRGLIYSPSFKLSGCDEAVGLELASSVHSWNSSRSWVWCCRVTWTTKETLTRNYRANGLVLDPNEGFGRSGPADIFQVSTRFAIAHPCTKKPASASSSPFVPFPCVSLAPSPTLITWAPLARPPSFCYKVEKEGWIDACTFVHASSVSRAQAPTYTCMHALTHRAS